MHDVNELLRQLACMIGAQPMRRIVMPAGRPDRQRILVGATIPANTGAATEVGQNGRKIFWLQFTTNTEGPAQIDVYLDTPPSGSSLNSNRPYATLANGGSCTFPASATSGKSDGVPVVFVRAHGASSIAGCSVKVSFTHDDAGDVVPGSALPLSAATISTTTVPTTHAGDFSASSGTATLNAGAASTQVLLVSTGLLFHGDLIVLEKHVGAAVGTPRAWAGEVWDVFYNGGATNDIYPQIPPTPAGSTKFLVCEIPEGVTGGVGNLSFRVNNPDTVQCTYRVASLVWR